MGPLEGVRVIELAGLGPAPFCGMVLADLGAEVIRVDRVSDVIGSPTATTRFDLHNRGKLSIGVDLKHEGGRQVLLDLAARADALIEGFRPGVTERLQLGPAECLARNARLVYGRMTGWGQEGPLAKSAGHDIDYIALSGALHATGPADSPIPPLNLVGDYGGGGMLLAVGVLAAIIQVGSTGKGQVVDAAMVDGSALLTTATHGFLAEGSWVDRRESNLLDGGAPFYSVYETSDGRHMAVGALEPQFFGELLDGLGIDPVAVGDQTDRSGWPRLRSVFEETFKTRTRQEWEDMFEGRDACVAPVLSLSEAPLHPHNSHRGTFVTVDGVIQPAKAPRFSATKREHPTPPSFPGSDTDRVLASLGYSQEQIGMLRAKAAVA
ncbi:MAG: CoA transferase [Acidobacteria bacterium]|nr:CoA transferase [Acidobacteriota bacterium]